MHLNQIALSCFKGVVSGKVLKLNIQINKEGELMID